MTKELNKYEEKLKNQIDTIMFQCKIKFPTLLRALRKDITITSPNYKKVLKSEYLKHLRASYTVKEIMDIADIIDCKIEFVLDGKSIPLKKFEIDGIRTKFVDLMAICDLFGINIYWHSLTYEEYKALQKKKDVKPK